ncbi:MAG: DeoR/GlpR family DNA-binding transcription regulator [Vibrio sp.]
MHQLSLRQQQIIELVKQKEYCAIDELAQHFSVTSQTMRRDINQLCDMGLTRRYHGGVGLPVALTNSSYQSRWDTNPLDKQKIAERVCQSIPDGATIFLGIGTTIAYIAKQLGQHQDLRVVTNNLEAANILSHYEHIETWLAGGRIRCKDRDIVSDETAAFYAQFVADIGIIGCGAILDLDSDPLRPNRQTQSYVMEYEVSEAKASQAILRHSKQKWLVTNNDKWGKKANAKVAPLTCFDQVFCDKNPDTD